MAKTIVQSVTFKQSPKTLYETYMNAKKHRAAIGSVVKAVVENKVGGRFNAYGMLRGKFIHLVKNKMIVQTWRARSWKKNDPDSILSITLHKLKKGTRLELVHIHVPDHDYRDIQKGWSTYYWKKWKKYFR